MRTLLGVLFLALGAPLGRAHPVAQGAIDIVISEGKIALQARVSLEEVFVENMFAKPPASTLPAASEQHGHYLLRHLRVFADGRQLVGNLLAPASGQEGATRVTYDFDFALATPARSLRIEQDVLNEFEYMPGNRWEATYLLRVKHGEHLLLEGALLTSKTPVEVSSSSRPGNGRMAGDYLRHGIRHILAGYDHLLFISALALAVANFWELFKVIAAFTLAHTLTLTLSVLNLVRLPSHLVEPMIAASIVIVALQNVFWPVRSRGAVRLMVAFSFGLFHGLGFAGGLVEAMSGMPGIAVGLAIISFSAGVELGHQVVVLPVFGLTRLVRAWRRREREPRGGDFAGELLLRGGSAAICAAGMFYLIAALTRAAG